MRTHRRCLVYNYVVTYQDNDTWSYAEWHRLKELLTRQEMLAIYKAIKAGKRYITLSNPVVAQIQFV